MNINDILDKFLVQLNKKEVTIKQGQFVQGRKAFNAHQAAEDFLGVIGEDESMSYELVKRAKEKLEQANKKESFIPSKSLIPELYTFTSESGTTTYWLKRDLSKEVYTLLSADLSNSSILIDSIIRLMGEDTRNNLLKLVTRVNEDNENDKMTLSILVSQVLSSNRDSVLNSLSEMPKTFTTDVKKPARIYFDLQRLPKEPKETPAWDSLTNRMTIEGTTLKGSEYFKGFIWSIFEETDKNRVFLYWYDSGNQGKSETVNVLMDVLKGASTAFDFFNLNSHSAESIVGKRLLVQHEAVVKKLSAIQLVKQITGGDAIVINPKGRKAYSINIDAKIIVLSNNSPIVSSQASELSRLLPIKNLPRTQEHEVNFFGEKLKEEVFDFLAKCKIAYNKLKSDNLKSNFLSIEKELKDVDIFKDYSGQLIDIIEAKYELNASAFGTKWKTIQKIINKELEEDESLKGNVNSASPQLLDFFDKWARKHGGSFIRRGSEKGFQELIFEKKKDKTKDLIREEINEL